MQCGYTVPAPTTKEAPQPFAPSAKFSCCCANEENRALGSEPPYF